MKIAINARMLKAVPDDGISRFTLEVVKRITANNPSHKFALIFDRKFEKELLFSGNTEAYLVSPAAHHPVQWYTWHEWQLPGILKKIGADIFLSPDGIISLRSDIPSVPVIHDINFYHRPADIPFLSRSYYRYFFRKFAEKATRLITVSNFCKNDISTYLNIDPSKIDVAYNGVSDYFGPVEKQLTDTYRKNITGGIPYFLFVGNFSPRKNIPGLLKAYNLFRETSGLNFKLVLAGGRLFLNSETDRLIRTSKWTKDIILTGPKKHEDLKMLYCSALSLVFVPWFEGFGIPAAESMRCGTPVILSNTTSLPEIGGNAALFVDPGSPENICREMIRLSNDNDLCSALSSSGQKQSKKFSWENTAESVWESLEKAFDSNNTD
jgi:glycosyltransferase involved in cell wall biosynthesis